MSGPFTVRYNRAAEDDLLRLFDHLLVQAQTIEDLDAAERVIALIRASVEGQLSRTPFIFRKVGPDAFLRELIIPFGHTGYVALFAIEDAATVTVEAVRHQREDDYH